MDALAPLGVAGVIAQFVGYGIKIISKSSEILASAESVTKNISNINTVYDNLHDLSVKLEDAYKEARNTSSGRSGVELFSLVTLCQRDCEELFKVIQNLKDQNFDQGSRLEQIKTAIVEEWKKTDIKEIDERLHRTQVTLNVILSFFITEHQKEQDKSLQRLQKDSERHRLNQERQFTELRRILASIEDHVLLPEGVGIASGLEHRDVIERPQGRLCAPHESVLRSFSHLDISDVEERFKSVLISTIDIEKQQAIIGSLDYEDRAGRHRAIVVAHSGTFQWAFGTEYKETENSRRFSDWLSNGTGIFWISGRPGSGKSTFMRHIVDSEDIWVTLKHWSSPQEAFISSYFFWSSGSSMQRSWEGMIKSLLFDLFCQYPSLMAQSCGKRWTSHGPAAWSEAWTLDELRNTLRAITSAKDLPAKVCFFIDGLDEYEGDHLEIVEDLVTLARSSNIKMCISSRSWNVFRNAFGHDEANNLYMHELTRDDIQIYVEDRLSTHPRWSKLFCCSYQAERFIHEVTQQSNGVFLWVSLVTKLLRDGLTNDDSLSDMYKRLASFPSDLKAVFDHIIQSVEPFYHQKMANTLRTATSAEEPLHVLFYEFHDQEHDDLDYHLHVRRQDLSESELQNIEQRVHRRINAYCKGLLEVQDHRVVFLHGTVADFLKTREIECEIVEKSTSWFSFELSMAKAHLAIMKVSPRGGERTLTRNSLKSHIESIMASSSMFDTGDTGVLEMFHEILDEVESDLSEWTAMFETICDCCQVPDFWEHLLPSGNPTYVARALQKGPNSLESFRGSPLSFLLEPCSIGNHMKTFRVLFEHGQDPNRELFTFENHTCRQTPWTLLISLTIPHSSDHIPEEDLLTFCPCCGFGLVELFLRSGADPNAMVYRQEIGVTSTVWIDCLLAAFKMNVTYEASYLDVLDLIARCKVWIPEAALHLGDVHCDLPTSEIIMRRFFRSLEALARSPEFAIQVSEKVMLMAYNAGWNMEATWPEVQEALGERQAQRLQHMYHNFNHHT